MSVFSCICASTFIFIVQTVRNTHKNVGEKENKFGAKVRLDKKAMGILLRLNKMLDHHTRKHGGSK